MFNPFTYRGKTRGEWQPRAIVPSRSGSLVKFRVAACIQIDTASHNNTSSFVWATIAYCVIFLSFFEVGASPYCVPLDGSNVFRSVRSGWGMKAPKCPSFSPLGASLFRRGYLNCSGSKRESMDSPENQLKNVHL